MKATFEWCLYGAECAAPVPWSEAKRTLGITVAVDTPMDMVERDLRHAVERYLTDCLTVALYVTDQYEVRRHTPPQAHFVIHEVEPHPSEIGKSGAARRWAAHYAGHVPPDELIEAQPEYGTAFGPLAGLEF